MAQPLRNQFRSTSIDPMRSASARDLSPDAKLRELDPRFGWVTEFAELAETCDLRCAYRGPGR